MIGVFDSGYGGLTILHGLIDALPQYDYLYLGDNARAPYGSRPAAEIIEYTQQGVDYLFQQGCPVVILACNTASAVALRSLQHDFLPQKYPNRRVLGIVVPTIEQITGLPWNTSLAIPDEPRTIGLLATEQTVASGSYAEEIKKRNPAVQLIQQAAPDLVKVIEAGSSHEIIKQTAQNYINQLMQQASSVTPALSAVVLGCTHFEIIADMIRELLPAEVALYEQPKIVATSFANYLQRHPEIEQKLSKTGQRMFLTSGDATEVSKQSEKFFGMKIKFESKK